MNETRLLRELPLETVLWRADQSRCCLRELLRPRTLLILLRHLH